MVLVAAAFSALSSQVGCCCGTPDTRSGDARWARGSALPISRHRPIGGGCIGSETRFRSVERHDAQHAVIKGGVVGADAPSSPRRLPHPLREGRACFAWVPRENLERSG
eukprot:913850-Pleurochrysis_carterae.AAC.7